jgi:WD40 repeat protein
MMATNNARNNKGQFPVGSVVKYDFSAPADTKWLLTAGAAVSKTTYAPLYALQGNAYEGTGNLTQVDDLAGEANKGATFVRWHPSTNYVAYGDSITNAGLGVASFNGTTLTEVEAVNLGDECYFIDWHPNGNFLAVELYTSKKIKIFSWNGSDTLTEVESVDTAATPYSVSWHPNGNFLAVTHVSGGLDEVSIYSWNGSDTLSQVETIDYSSDVYGCRWSRSGNYLAASGNLANNQLKIFSWNGSDTLTYVCAYDYGAGPNYIEFLDWSLDDNFIAAGGNSDTKQLVVLSFNGAALTERATIDYGTSLSASPRWSKGGNYLAVALNGLAGTADGQFLYTWVPSSYTLTQVDTLSMVRNGSWSSDFNYTNNYYAYSLYQSTGSAPHYKLYAGTTGLTSCDYRTNFLLQTTATSIIRAK